MNHWYLKIITILRWALKVRLLRLAFRHFLPFAARLPTASAAYSAHKIGIFFKHLDLDWRTAALREHYVSNRTCAAFREIHPEWSQGRLHQALTQRFATSSREELEGHWFETDIPRTFRCHFSGLEAVYEWCRNGKGAVFLTMHYDAPLMGVVQLGLAGVKANLMTSDVVEDPRVDPVIRKYFVRKYTGIGRFLNGGHALHVERSLRSFYTGLRNGTSTIILCDAPTHLLDDALEVKFLGKRRAVAPGCIRIAEKSGVPVVGFICNYLAPGQYQLKLTPLYFPDATGSHVENAQRIFDFFSSEIIELPDVWWAADQLPNFINLDNS